jgi:hypothetical protein
VPDQAGAGGAVSVDRVMRAGEGRRFISAFYDAALQRQQLGLA